jgi:serine/threonine protein kinase
MAATLRVPFNDIPAGTRVAVKTFKPWVLQEPGQIERIFREVEIGRSVVHPNVLRVLGAVSDLHGRPAIVMSYYEGPTLEGWLAGYRERNEMLAATDGISILRDLASGLLSLHRAGVVHRDVKPANVILTSQGAVLADFGVIRSTSFPEQTTTGAFLGTIRYAAREYLAGEAYSQTVDIYGWGAIAYELFTGRQSYAQHQHWARLVSAKLNSDEGLTDEEKKVICARHGFKVGRFIQTVIGMSRCDADMRTIDLENFIEAARERLWERPFRVRDGVIAPGWNPCPDAFVTADRAAEAVTTRLSAADIEVLKSLLSHYYWDESIPASSVDEQLLQRFSAAHILEMHWRPGMNDINAMDSVKEAFTFGLI